MRYIPYDTQKYGIYKSLTELLAPPGRAIWFLPAGVLVISCLPSQTICSKANVPYLVLERTTCPGLYGLSTTGSSLKKDGENIIT